MPFHRVRVPGGRLGDVPLGSHRLVPVPVEEFEAALAAAGGDGGPEAMPPAIRRQTVAITEATCIATLDVEGREGSAEVLALAQDRDPRESALKSLE